MKRIIILSIVYVIFSNNIFSQRTLTPYRPLTEFNNDISTYLEYNFDKRSLIYYQKTFSEFMKDLEIEPIGYVRTWSYLNDDQESYTININLYFKCINDSYSELNDTYLIINWETPFQNLLLIELEKNFPSKKWASQHFDFFKDKKIKSIEFNPYIKAKRLK